MIIDAVTSEVGNVSDVISASVAFVSVGADTETASDAISAAKTFAAAIAIGINTGNGADHIGANAVFASSVIETTVSDELVATVAGVVVGANIEIAAAADSSIVSGNVFNGGAADGGMINDAVSAVFLSGTLARDPSKSRLQTLITMSAEEIDYVGDPVRAAGWYGPTKGLHTIAIKAQNFSGTLVIEGTLAAAPGNTDWFTLYEQTYPRADLPPAPALYAEPSWQGESSTIGVNLIVNCLYVRARVVRSNIIPPTFTGYEVAKYGALDYVMMQF